MICNAVPKESGPQHTSTLWDQVYCCGFGATPTYVRTETSARERKREIERGRERERERERETERQRTDREETGTEAHTHTHSQQKSSTSMQRHIFCGTAARTSACRSEAFQMPRASLAVQARSRVVQGLDCRLRFYSKLLNSQSLHNDSIDC